MKIEIYRYALCLMLVFASVGGADYRIVWSTLDGGGGTISGGPYLLTNTIGQPDAAISAGGDYELLGGFWPGGPLCVVTLEDFAHFAQSWLDSPCDAGNHWCGGADLNTSGDVSLTDFTVFLDAWLAICPYDWPLK
jgi:hypothetical protein